MRPSRSSRPAHHSLHNRPRQRQPGQAWHVKRHRSGATSMTLPNAAPAQTTETVPAEVVGCALRSPHSTNPTSASSVAAAAACSSMTFSCAAARRCSSCSARMCEQSGWKCRCVLPMTTSCSCRRSTSSCAFVLTPASTRKASAPACPCRPSSATTCWRSSRANIVLSGGDQGIWGASWYTVVCHSVLTQNAEQKSCCCYRLLLPPPTFASASTSISPSAAKCQRHVLIHHPAALSAHKRCDALP